MTRKASTVRVLQSMAAPDGTTKFSVQLAEGVADGVELRFFTWRAALLTHFDILHVHWPEFLVRGGSAPKTAMKSFLVLALLAKLTVLRVPVVRTVHNETPHEPGSAVERMLLHALDRRTTRWIILNPYTHTPRGTADARRLIPHGHYVEWYAHPEDIEHVRGRLLLCGLLRPYKGIEALIEAMETAPSDEFTLEIMGKPVIPTYAEDLRRRTEDDPRINLRLGFAPDEELARQILASEVVVLPYERMHNSGILFLALSLGRPVVAPRNPVTQWISEEVGDGWLLLFDPPFTGDALWQRVEGLRNCPPHQAPEFAGRGWREIGEAHAAVYREVANR